MPLGPIARVAAAAVVIAGLAGCGGVDRPDETRPPAPQPPTTPPPVVSIDLAAGRLADGTPWRLVATGPTSTVCLRIHDVGGVVEDCTDHDPWAIGALERRVAGSPSTVVYGALVSCVARLELRDGTEVVGSAETMVDDDVAFGVVEAPRSTADVTLVGVGRIGGTLLEIDRLGSDPSKRIPVIGC